MNICKLEINENCEEKLKPLYYIKLITIKKLEDIERKAKIKLVETILSSIKSDNKSELHCLLEYFVVNKNITSKDELIENLKNIDKRNLINIMNSVSVLYRQIIRKIQVMEEEEIKEKLNSFIIDIQNKEFNYEELLKRMSNEIKNIDDNIYNTIVEEKYNRYGYEDKAFASKDYIYFYENGLVLIITINKNKFQYKYKFYDITSKNLLEEYVKISKVKFNMYNKLLENDDITPNIFVNIVKGGFTNMERAEILIFAENHGVTGGSELYELSKFYDKDPIYRNKSKYMDYLEKSVMQGYAPACIKKADICIANKDFFDAEEYIKKAEESGYDVKEIILKLENSKKISKQEEEDLINKPQRNLLLDEIVEDYKKRTKKDCYNILIEKDIVPDILNSKIGGKPYLPIGEEMPKDDNGEYMPLLIQINFSEFKSDIYPQNGILEIFLDKTLGYPPKYEVRFYKDIQDKYQTEFPEIDLSEFVLAKSLKIKFEKSVTYMPVSDYRSASILNGYIDKILKDENSVKCFKEIAKKDMKYDLNKYSSDKDLLEDVIWNKICDDIDTYPIMLGGYADYTQTDPRIYEKDKIDFTECLIKIDEYGHEDFVIGDIGIISVIISKEDLVNGDFKRAYLSWDCA